MNKDDVWIGIIVLAVVVGFFGVVMYIVSYNKIPIVPEVTSTIADTPKDEPVKIVNYPCNRPDGGDCK